MNEKLKQVGKYWGDNHRGMSSYGMIDTAELRPFKGTHPEIVKQWIKNESEQAFEQSPHYELTRRDYRNRIRFRLEDLLNLEISKKHYKALD